MPNPAYSPQLHDLFHAINQHGLDTVKARTCTDTSMAINTPYIITPDRKKIGNPVPLKQIEAQFTALVSRPESTD